MLISFACLGCSSTPTENTIMLGEPLMKYDDLLKFYFSICVSL